MTDQIRVVFMGTPDFAVPSLAALLDHPRFDVVLVVTQPDRPKGRGRKLASSPVKLFAESNDLPVIQPEKAKEPGTIVALTAAAPDYLVVVAYGQILPQEILAIPRMAPINLHGSLLPRWRGAAPIHRAFLAGDAATGVCAMVMEAGLDTGPTLLCESTEITDDDTVEHIHDRLATMGGGLITTTLIAHAAGQLTPLPQPEQGVTYAAKLTPADFAIDWSQPAATVSRQIRGLSPYPGAVTRFLDSGEIIKPLFAKVVAGDGLAGSVISTSHNGMVIACGKGAVLVTTLKPEGKGAMSAAAFINGHPVTLGTRLT
jgi:methionyl-tRNA formyltransferase